MRPVPAGFLPVRPGDAPARSLPSAAAGDKIPGHPRGQGGSKMAADDGKSRAQGKDRQEESIFPTFFMAGFECSTFIWKDRQRKDYVALTGHDRHLKQDYERLEELGI